MPINSAYTATVWVDDDGSGVTGTTVSAQTMNNIESGVGDASLRTRVVRWAATDNQAIGTLGAAPRIDGNTPGDGDLVLLAGQTNAAENGVYLYRRLVNLQGVTTYSLSRAATWSAASQVKQGQAIFVLSGLAHAGKVFVVGADCVTLGTTAIPLVPGAQAVRESWTALPYNAGWADYSGGQQACQYRKDEHGVVHLRGLATYTGGTLGTGALQMATLPLGYRPPVVIVMATLSGESAKAGRVDIRADGTMWASATAANTELDWITLSGLYFFTD